jgi:transposase
MGRHSKPIIFTESEQTLIRKILDGSRSESRSYRRAGILSQLCLGARIDNTSTAWQVSPATVANIKRRFFEGGLNRALLDLPRAGAPRSISPMVEADILMLASSAPPESSDCWTLRFLAEKAVEHGFVKSISHNQIGLILKKNNFSLRRATSFDNGQN